MAGDETEDMLTGARSLKAPIACSGDGELSFGYGRPLKGLKAGE